MISSGDAHVFTRGDACKAAACAACCCCCCCCCLLLLLPRHSAPAAAAALRCLLKEMNHASARCSTSAAPVLSATHCIAQSNGKRQEGQGGKTGACARVRVRVPLLLRLTTLALRIRRERRKSGRALMTARARAGRCDHRPLAPPFPFLTKPRRRQRSRAAATAALRSALCSVGCVHRGHVTRWQVRAEYHRDAAGWGEA